MSITGNQLVVKRADLSDARIVSLAMPDTPAPGTCILRVDQFALTANNITYAVAPEAMGYWNFFPVDEEGFGRVPVWGFAEVIASAVEDIAVGTRLYGYLPMATHLTVEPGAVKSGGFADAAAHRQPMSPIYNAYLNVAADPTYSPDREGLISLYRPLFTTSFLLDDLHRKHSAFGSTQILLSSASSKTAIGLAHLLQSNRIDDVEVIGLTSPGNVDFVKGLGCYDTVFIYEDVPSIPRKLAAFVDMAGNSDLLRAVHGHFENDLKNSCRVGLTHWHNTQPKLDNLPGPQPEFIFAPSYAQDRLAEWGGAGFNQRLGAAWASFIAMAEGWTKIIEERGPEHTKERYLQMLKGQIDPAAGHMLSLHG